MKANRFVFKRLILREREIKRQREGGMGGRDRGQEEKREEENERERGKRNRERGR